MFKRKNKPVRHGGFAFYASLLCLLLLSGVNLLALPLLWDSNAEKRIFQFLLGLALGTWFAWHFITGRVRVFFHEFKHALPSGLVGNKFKGLTIKRHEGLYEYSHTRENAEYNAFIAMGPYWIPLFTIPTIFISHIWFRDSHELLIFLGIAYGMDCIMNLRDIHPGQTDLLHTRGGLLVSLLYLLAINLTVFTYLLAFVMQGMYGIKLTMVMLWEVGVYIYALFYVNVHTRTMPGPPS